MTIMFPNNHCVNSLLHEINPVHYLTRTEKILVD